MIHSGVAFFDKWEVSAREWHVCTRITSLCYCIDEGFALPFSQNRFYGYILHLLLPGMPRIAPPQHQRPEECFSGEPRQHAGGCFKERHEHPGRLFAQERSKEA